MTPPKSLPRETIKRSKKLKENAYKGFEKRKSIQSCPVNTYRELIKSKDLGIWEWKPRTHAY